MANSSEPASGEDIRATDTGFAVPLDLVGDTPGQQPDAEPDGRYSIPLDLLETESAADGQEPDFEAG
jgi:hypothetical protein